MASLVESSGHAGDEGSFEALYTTYRGEVHRLASYLLRNASDAEDASQTVFLNVLRALRQGVRPSEPRAWLLAITRNVCFSRRRAAAARPDEVELDLERAADANGGDGPGVEDIVGALSRMLPNQRTALILRDFRGAPRSEICDLLGMSPTGVETLLTRARASFREEIEAGRQPFDCAETRALVEQQLAGAISVAERHSLRAHLRHCASCSTLARAVRSSKGKIAGFLVWPVDLVSRLASALSQAPSALHVAAAVGSTAAVATVAIPVVVAHTPASPHVEGRTTPAAPAATWSRPAASPDIVASATRAASAGTRTARRPRACIHTPAHARRAWLHSGRRRPGTEATARGSGSVATRRDDGRRGRFRRRHAFRPGGHRCARRLLAPPGLSPSGGIVSGSHTRDTAAAAPRRDPSRRPPRGEGEDQAEGEAEALRAAAKRRASSRPPRRPRAGVAAAGASCRTPAHGADNGPAPVSSSGSWPRLPARTTSSLEHDFDGGSSPAGGTAPGTARAAAIPIRTDDHKHGQALAQRRRHRRGALRWPRVPASSRLPKVRLGAVDRDRRCGRARRSGSRRATVGAQSPPTSTPTTAAGATGSTPVVPVTPGGLQTLVGALQRPIYWAGEEPGKTYELTQSADGKVYLRYLPHGVRVGTQKAELTVGTYPVASAFTVTQGRRREVGLRTGPRPGGRRVLQQEHPDEHLHRLPGDRLPDRGLRPVGCRGEGARPHGKIVAVAATAPSTSAAPALVSPGKLKAVARSLDHPLYWAGYIARHRLRARADPG